MTSRRAPMVLLVLAIASALLVVGLWATDATDTPASGTSAPAEPPEAASRARALTVLRSWDERRAAAYAAGDADAVSALYLPGSDSGRNDRQVLSQYLRRGLRVQDMRTQILDLQITAHEETSLSLLVTDRLSGAVAVGRRVQLRLPRDQATTREIELRRVGNDWLVDEAEEIDGEPSDQPAAGRSSAAESTSTTPASRRS